VRLVQARGGGLIARKVVLLEQDQSLVVQGQQRRSPPRRVSFQLMRLEALIEDDTGRCPPRFPARSLHVETRSLQLTRTTGIGATRPLTVASAKVGNPPISGARGRRREGQLCATKRALALLVTQNRPPLLVLGQRRQGRARHPFRDCRGDCEDCLVPVYLIANMARLTAQKRAGLAVFGDPRSTVASAFARR
jgi:hypothetical protein